MALAQLNKAAGIEIVGVPYRGSGEAAREVASGAIQVPIAATYPRSALREAVLHVGRGGKVLLDLNATI